jgi:predicted transcriptional regulator
VKRTKAAGNRRNVTLSLPADLLRRARHLAVVRGVSLSRMLAEELESLVAKEDQYEAAQKRLLARMRKGFKLGLKDGRVPWTRDELHER